MLTKTWTKSFAIGPYCYIKKPYARSMLFNANEVIPQEPSPNIYSKYSEITLNYLNEDFYWTDISVLSTVVQTLFFALTPSLLLDKQPMILRKDNHV